MATKKKAVRAPGHVGNVDAAVAAREAKVGKTVRLRALSRGYYGLAGVVADLRDPGDVFSFAIKDLEPFKRGKYADGQERRSVTIDGIEYGLPSWCEDASNPVRVDEDEDELETVPSANDDVI